MIRWVAAVSQLPSWLSTRASGPDAVPVAATGAPASPRGASVAFANPVMSLRTREGPSVGSWIGTCRIFSR